MIEVVHEVGTEPEVKLRDAFFNQTPVNGRVIVERVTFADDGEKKLYAKYVLAEARAAASSCVN
jgi:hypothetical protein